jgi:hypothetical protein
MTEVPVVAGPSGIKLTGITAKDEAQLESVLLGIEQYAQQLVVAFEATTKQIHQRLNDTGGVAIQALSALSGSHDELQNVINGSFEELKAIILAIESIGREFDGLDRIQNELLLLSDLLTAVEETVKRPQ